MDFHHVAPRLPGLLDGPAGLANRGIGRARASCPSAAPSMAALVVFAVFVLSFDPDRPQAVENTVVKQRERQIARVDIGIAGALAHWR